MDYEKLGAELGRLVNEKQAAYGASYSKSGEVMRLLYPEGVKPEQMTDALAVVRVIDKLFRIATRKDAFGESPWRDIAGYGLLGAGKDASPPPTNLCDTCFRLAANTCTMPPQPYPLAACPAYAKILLPAPSAGLPLKPRASAPNGPSPHGDEPSEGQP